MKKKYTYPAIVADGYDSGRLWVANFPGLSGCWAEGPTREDVVSRGEETLRLYIKSCLDAEWPLPEPTAEEELENANVGDVVLFSCELEQTEENNPI